MADAKRSRPALRARARGRSFPMVLALAGVALALSGSGLPPGPAIVAPSAHALVSDRAVEPVQVFPDFTHADHDTVQCFTCHETGDQHGALLMRTIQDCRSCHHTAPLSTSCSQCHAAADAPDETYAAVRTVSFSVGTGDAARALGFLHQPHAAIGCARCHTEGAALAVATDLDCAGCHEDHHTATSDCAS